MSYLEGLTFEQIAGPLPERHLLANGLEVIYSHRPGIGLCSVQAWVRTGSMHEGRWEGAGLSHYLEHMVFKGTGRFSNKEITQLIHRAGGVTNAYTTLDRTVYYVDAPQEGFETTMEIIADMVFDPLLTDADAKLERDVILREIAMGEDDHDSVLFKAVITEAVRAQAFRHPVIGHRDLFTRLTPDDLRAYHAARYIPNNTVLAIGGSLPPAEVFAAAEKYFGRYARRPLHDLPLTSEPPQGGFRRTDLVREVTTVQGVLAWRIPGNFAEGRMAIDLCASVLGSGASSLLWNELREKRKLVNAIDLDSFGTREIGLVCGGWIGDASTSVSAVEQAVTETTDRLLQRGVTVEEFGKVRRQAVVGMINGQKSISAVTARNGFAAAMGYDLGWPMRSVEHLAQLTPEALTKEGRQWLTLSQATFGTMRGQAVAVVAPNPVAVVVPDKFETLVLDNGVRVVLQLDPTIPKAGVGVFLEGGPAFETADKRGLTCLLGTLFTRDTAKRTKEEVAQLVDSLGATFTDTAAHFFCGLWGEALTSDFNLLAELVADGVLCPRLVAETVEIERATQITACRQAEDDIVTKARLGLNRQFFGAHPLGVELIGTPETLLNIQAADLAALHQRLVVAGNLIVGISGAFDRQTALDFVHQRFGSLPKVGFGSQKIPQHQPRPAHQAEERAKGEQAVVYLGFPHCGFGPVEVVAASLIDELLSGMASALFRRIREEKGLAYFVGASRMELVDQGIFYVCAGTAPAKAEEVLGEMRLELARLRKGEFGAEEVADAKRRLRVARRQSRQSAGARMQGALVREVAGLGVHFDAEWERRMNLTDAAALQAYARRYLDPRFEQVMIVLPKV